MKQYKVVRSYGPDSISGYERLAEAFDEGWQYVTSSDYIPGEDDEAGYIEYILCKEVES